MNVQTEDAKDGDDLPSRSGTDTQDSSDTGSECAREPSTEYTGNVPVSSGDRITVLSINPDTGERTTRIAGIVVDALAIQFTWQFASGSVPNHVGFKFYADEGVTWEKCDEQAES